jgi:hypothetical protein
MWDALTEHRRAVRSAATTAERTGARWAAHWGGMPVSWRVASSELRWVVQ